jgi:hypothetical protein
MINRPHQTVKKKSLVEIKNKLGSFYLRALSKI